jgi:hypothetical protein
MRAGDLNAWDWTMIDRVHFAECFVPRSKTRTPQALAVPEVLAPFLRAWWERAGKPESGPVFPSRRGKRAGEIRKASGGFAFRLRRDLFAAGVYRMAPVEVPATRRGQRTDLAKKRAELAPFEATMDGTKPAPNPRDPLYFETPSTLPVDWHSFRRAYASALADAGVNVQHAMILSAHSDARVHSRYVNRSAAMQAIPDAALPRLQVGALTEDAGRPVSFRVESSESTGKQACAGSGFAGVAVSQVGATVHDARASEPFTRTKSQVQSLLRPPEITPLSPTASARAPG